jgi:hypothetical protein
MMAQIDMVEALRPFGQDRVEKELIAALRPFRALSGWRATAMGGTLDASDLVPGKRGAIEYSVREIVRRGGRMNGVGDTPAPYELH